MRTTFLANLLLILLINILVKPIYIFGIDITVQNRLGPSEYGVFFTLFSFTYLFQIINDFGIQIYNTRTLANAPERLFHQFIAFLKIKFGLALVYTAVIWLVAWVLGYTIYGWLLAFILFNQVLLSLVLFLRSNISGLGFYRTDSVLSALDKAIMIVVCGVLLYVPSTGIPFTLSTFVYAQTFSLGVTAIIAFIVISRAGKQIGKHGSGEDIAALFKAAGPYALAVFLMTIYTRIDTVMIEQIGVNGTTEAGIYAAGFRLLDAANMIAFLFTPLLLPMFSKLLDKPMDLKPLLKASFEAMWMLCISVSATCFVFRQEIMELLYPAADSHWVAVFGLLILGFIPMGLAYVFGTLQTARGKMRRLNLLYLWLVIANIGLNALLIPRYGAEGAAMATLVTQGIATCVLTWMTKVDYRLGVNSGYLAKIAAFGILIAVGATLVRQILGWPLLPELLVTGVIILLLARVFGLLKPQFFIALIRSRGAKT